MGVKSESPLKYYGGKANLASTIISLIDKCEHLHYVEPFFGSGAVFWKKKPSKFESINDYDERVMNFWLVCKDAKLFSLLQKEIEKTLHSESMYKRARNILKTPIDIYDGSDADKVMFAWSTWCCLALGFGHKFDSSYGHSDSAIQTKKLLNNKSNFAFSVGIEKEKKRRSLASVNATATSVSMLTNTNRIHDRLKNVQIFCRDTNSLFDSCLDKEETLWFFDPPYVGSNCGHYKDYSQEDFNQLLHSISKLKGSFILSSYPNDSLFEYRDKFGWNNLDQKDIKVAINGKRTDNKLKTECITYRIKPKNKTLFS